MEFAGAGELDQAKPMSMRVLHIIPSVAPVRGGPSQAVVEMVAALNSSGMRAEIATTNDNGDIELDVKLQQLVDFDGAPTRFFKRFSPPLSALREFQYSGQFKRWLKHHINDYDLIHVHAIFSYCSSYAMWLARKRSIPYIVRPIGQLEAWALQQSGFNKQLYLKLVESANLHGAHAVHFTAESEARQALQLFPELKPLTVQLGVGTCPLIRDAGLKLRKRYQLDQNAPIICSVSRLHPKKGLDLLIRALASIESPWQLLIAGEGDKDYRQKLEKIIADSGSQAKIKLLGFVRGTEKHLLLQGSDLFALTSYSENFGIGVLEALAAGTPALVTEPVALSSQIKAHNLGFVAEMNSESIRATMLNAMRDIEDGEVSASAIREHVAHHYQWSAVANNLKQLYRSITD